MNCIKTNTATIRITVLTMGVLVILGSLDLHGATFNSTNDVGCVLTCTLASTDFSMGEPILMFLSLSNSVEGIVQTSAHPTFGTFAFSMRQKNVTVPMTAMGKKVHLTKSLSGGKRPPLRLEMGDVFTHQVRLNWLFDMIVPGDYEASISTPFIRIHNNQTNKGKVSIQNIRIRVVPPEAMDIISSEGPNNNCQSARETF